MAATTSERASPVPTHGIPGTLTAHALWPMAAAVAASIATERALPLALVVATILLGLRWLAVGRPLPATVADWPIGGLVVMALISLLITSRPELTAPQVGRLLLGIALFYCIVGWATTAARLRLVAAGLAATGLLLALGAFVSVEWGTAGAKLPLIPAVYARFQRLVADSVNPNVMAGYLALLLPCALGPLLYGWGALSRAERILACCAVALMPAVLVLTQSRAGLLAAAASLGCLACLRWRGARIAALLLLLATVVAFVAGAGPRLAELAGTNINFATLETRREIWVRALWMLRDFAFTGIGMGSFAVVTERFYPLLLSPPGVPHAHNLLLQVGVDLGVPGLLAYLALLVVLIAAGWRAHRYAQTAAMPLLAGLAAGLLAAQVALLTHGMLDAVTWGMVRPAVLVWGLWGAIVALPRGPGAELASTLSPEEARCADER